MNNALLHRRRQAQSYIAIILYLCGFVILLLLVSRYYLFPAMQAASTATPGERRVLSAYATLVAALVLFVLLMGLLITFRIGRFFRPRSGGPSKPSTYVDAWRAAGERAKTPDSEELEQ